MNIKKIFSGIITSIAILVIGAGVVSATAPVVSIDPIGPLEYAVFPQNYNVTGTLNHSPNIASVSELKLFINNVQEGTTQNPNETGTSATFSLPWNITGPGTYTVKVTARHGNDTGEDSEEVVVSQTEVVVAQCKAAPAVANELLKLNLKKSKATDTQNYVSQVAKHMGPQTDFDGVTACNASAYRSAVDNYLDNVVNAY